MTDDAKSYTMPDKFKKNESVHKLNWYRYNDEENLHKISDSWYWENSWWIFPMHTIDRGTWNLMCTFKNLTKQKRRLKFFDRPQACQSNIEADYKARKKITMKTQSRKW